MTVNISVNTYFEVKAKYANQEKEKVVSETYVVPAFTFGEAEEKVTNYLNDLAMDSTGTDIIAIKRAKYGELLYDEERELPEKFAVVTVVNIIENDGGKTTKIATQYLVQADNIDDAKAIVKERIGKSVVDWYIDAIAMTGINDVVEG